jgi:MSHA pilin protein MshC
MIVVRTKTSGFTLVELIVVLIIVGVLAVATLPRFFDQSTFDDRGFYDETLAILRYAQKTAVAQRRLVCVTFTATTVALKIAHNFGGACTDDVMSPNGTASYKITAHGSSQFSTIPSAISFNPDGSASAAASIQVSGAANVISVDAVTGYVY